MDSRNKWLFAENDVFLKDCNCYEYQASGHGGQKVNRKYSAIKVEHLPSNFSAYSSKTRSQNENKKYAIDKIKFLISFNIRCSDLSKIKEFIHKNKFNNLNELKNHVWIAIILDLLFIFNFDNKKVAEIISISVSRLIKTIYYDKIIWKFINNQRNIRNMKVLMPPKKR